jgi:DNA modification methylase
MNKENEITISYIKNLGKNKCKESLDVLLKLYADEEISLELKREVVSSIGRQDEKKLVAKFIEENYKSSKNSMDMIYQFYRTCLYNMDILQFERLANEIETFYQNEMISKMKSFYLFRKNRGKHTQLKSKIIEPTLLVGDCELTLKRIENGTVNLIFTSPPYYNAREYSVYKSYDDYLNKMKSVWKECKNVLEDGRFLVINVSPVITKRPGREFESIRYPIHFDFHRILVDIGFEFVDEIIWLKPEYSVPNRNGGYMQTQMPLSYKPNCVTESVMVYRKKAPFLLDKNINVYKDFNPVFRDDFDKTNCWLISPRSSKNHPAVFPEELCERIIHYYSFPGDIVLDPFGGSGTFGDVAIKMGRTPLLCEMHDEYVKHILSKGYVTL